MPHRTAQAQHQVMVRARRPPALRELVDVVLAGFISLLLVGLEGTVPLPAEAGTGSTITAIRVRQVRAEATMRRADKQVKRLKKQRGQQARRFAQAKRRFERRIERRDAARRRAERAEDRLLRAREVLGRTLRVRPNPSGVLVADRPSLRRRVRRFDARAGRLDRRERRAVRKVERARAVKQRWARKVGKGRIAARREARERAEAVLSGQITRMLALSKARADGRMGSASARRFRRPARGYISQGYGCQRSRKATHGDRICTHFHDGIDIAAPRGTKVRAAADGYVAYVGWNPWDRGRRAYVVIIGHAGGYETIYGHLKPARKVRAGQRVRRGQVIGVVGMTGHSSGPHVHWEVSRDFRTLDPFHAGT